MTTRHKWEVTWSGGYDTISTCKHCKKEFMESADAPDKVLPVEGCIEHEPDTSWYAGITEKHYDIALNKAVKAERERILKIIKLDSHGSSATSYDWTITIYNHFKKLIEGKN